MAGRVALIKATVEILKLLRPAQWVKNIFVAVPLFLTPSMVSFHTIYNNIIAIMSFSLLASSIYVINDIFDRDSDRQHPAKAFRPIASGAVSIFAAWPLALILMAGGVLLGVLLPTDFMLVAAGYLAINLAYCFGLKHVSLIDVLIISAGFILRILAGAVVVGVHPTHWIILCGGLLALFLALAKRRDDVVRGLDSQHRPSLDGYNQPFLDGAILVVLSALLLAYILYTVDEKVVARFGSENLIWTSGFVIFGVLRYLQITMVEQRSGSPTRIFLTDLRLQLAVSGWVVTLILFMYGPGLM